MIQSLSLDATRRLYSTLLGQAEGCTAALGECFFHTVEALVVVEEAEGIDPMSLFVLRSLEFAHPADVEHLDGILHIGRQVMRQMLNGMVTNGLVATESGSKYRLTESGRNTLQTGQVVRRIPSRRVFHFLHPAMNYVAVHDPKGKLLRDVSPSRAPAPWEFSPDVLRHAIAQSAEWKQRHGFPSNVADVLTEPLSSETTKPFNPEEGVAAAPADPSQGHATPLQHLVVDKAHVATCLLVVRHGDADDFALTGHPVSVHGDLVQVKQPFFSLHDPVEVSQVFPALMRPPTPQEVADGWLALAARLMLPEAEQAEVRLENNVLVTAILMDPIGPWMKFVALAMQGQFYWQIPQSPLLKLCKVAVEGADSATNSRLQVLRSVLILEQDSRRGEIVRSEDSLRDWLATQDVPHELSSRDLANAAFRFGRYRLAYEVSELGDMSDVAV